jgi:hypothetical protein
LLSTLGAQRVGDPRGLRVAPHLAVRLAAAEVPRRLGDTRRRQRKGLLHGQPPTLHPGERVREHGEPMVEAIFGPRRAVLRQHRKGRTERPQGGSPSAMFPQAEALAQRTGRVVVHEGRPEPRFEACGLLRVVDGAVELHPPVLHERQIAPHGLASEQTASGGQIELPVVPLAGEHAVSHAALGERVSLVGTAIVEGVHHVALSDTDEALPLRLAQHRDPLVELVEGGRDPPSRQAVRRS